MFYKSTQRILIDLSKSEEGYNSNQYDKILIQFKKIDVNKRLNKANNKLKVALNNEIPGLGIIKECFSRLTTIPNSANYSNIRFILHDSLTLITTNNISICNSHVVEIIPISNNNYTNNRAIFEYTAIIDSAEQLYSIIEDVMLDIQMFYYFGFDRNYISITEKKTFSLLKVNYCNKHITSGKISFNYYSIASLCRDKDYKLNYNDYIEKWNDFERYINSINNKVISKDTTINIVNQIITKHPYGMQISKKKLLSMISVLGKGRYILVFLYSRPRNKRDIRILLPMLKGNKLRRGSIKIISYDLLFKYKRQYKYLCLYPFEIN